MSSIVTVNQATTCVFVWLSHILFADVLVPSTLRMAVRIQIANNWFVLQSAISTASEFMELNLCCNLSMRTLYQTVINK